MRLHYTVDGPADAPVIVLGGALGTTGAMWQPQVAALSEHFRVVRYDQRGHGGSPVPPGPYTIDGLAEDLTSLIDELGADQVDLVGLSLGGMVAMAAAARAPQRIRRLALISTSAHLGPAQPWLDRASAVRSGGMSAVTDTVLDRWFTPEFAGRNRGLVAWVRRMLATAHVEGYAACCEAISRMDLAPVLPTIAAPTLVISADHDPSTPPPMLEAIAAAIPRARLESIPDAAHLCNVQQPDTVNSLLLSFLR